MGQLRLDSKPAAFRGGVSKNTLVPGKPDESELYRRVSASSSQARMPMGGELAANEIELIRRWIEEGAEWPDEPAYQSGLGWALYKQPKPDTARAREHLETASSGAPDDAVNLFRLGVVMRALGESDEGDALIARARGLDPSVGE